jgi:CDP-diglyceride synthetase
MKEWYFYDDCVIGRMDTINKCHTYTYFVANEMFNIVDTFYTEKDWKTFIALHHLEPFIWKRTYAEEWSQITETNFFVLFIFGFYISIPLTIIMFVIVKRAIKRENFNKRKPYTITTLIIIGLFVLRYLLEIFPGSI